MPRRTLALALLFLAGETAILAQDNPAVRKGTTEIGGFVGSSYGIDEFRVMGGGNVAYAVTRRVMPYAEFSYFPGIGRAETVTLPTGSVKLNYSIPMADFHGGVHYRIPIKESRIVPYLVFGMGMVHTLKQTENVTITSSGFSTARVAIDVPARSDFAVNFGGGLRFYLKERLGFRLEAKSYKPSGLYSDVFGKVEAGFFFQIR